MYLHFFFQRERPNKGELGTNVFFISHLRDSPDYMSGCVSRVHGPAGRQVCHLAEQGEMTNGRKAFSAGSAHVKDKYGTTEKK